MWRRDYATYNDEFVAAIEERPGKMSNLNCYYKCFTLLKVGHVLTPVV